jgi:magnesium-transporting ATPase (P-type)
LADDSEKKILLNEAMACCQSVTYVNGELIGDPLEINLLQDTDWVLDEQNTVSNSSIGANNIVLAYVYPNRDDKRYE